MAHIARRSVLKGLAAATVLGAAGRSWAQDWPTHNVEIINPFPAGSGTDLVTRVYARMLEAKFGKPATVNNVPGSAAALGTARIASSAPDGYTIGMISTSSVLAAHVMEVPYKMDESFEYIGQIADLYQGILIPASSPLKTVDDLIALARQKRVTYAANSAVGAAPMFALAKAAGVEFNWVVFQSAIEVISAIAGGHVDCGVSSGTDGTPQIQGGNLRLLASASSARWPGVPDVPTLMELGYNIEAISQIGFVFPKGVDPSIRDAAQLALEEGMKNPVFDEELTKLGVIKTYRTGKEFEASVLQSEETLVPVLKAAGMIKS